MKKFLGLFLTFILMMSSAFAENMKFIQVSDAKFSLNNNTIEGVINKINNEKDVEFVVFTGDNIAKPTKENLVAFLKEVKKLHTPFYVALGDKDINKYKDLSKNDYFRIINKNIKNFKQKTPNFVFERNNNVFIIVDGAKEVITTPNGYYNNNTISWLSEQLNIYSDKNVVIFQHFPIIPPSNKETYYTSKPENYFNILQNRLNVKAIIAGHFNVNKEQNANGIIHISTSSVPYYRVIEILDAETNNPTIWTELKSVE